MLSYQIIGSGKPVIMIHGFPNSHTAWLPQAEILAKEFKVILPDLYGAGQSPEFNEGELSIEIMAAGILEIIEKENLESTLIIGHSMGGYTTIACLEKFPEKIAGISMVHSLASGDTEEKKEVRKKSMVLFNKGEEEKEAFLKGMAKNLFTPAFASANPEIVQSIVNNGMQLSMYALTQYYTAMMHRPDRTEVLKTSKVPVQWIIGAADQTTPSALALEQCHLAAVNAVHLYPDVAHMSMMEDPEKLIQDLSDFCHFCLD